MGEPSALTQASRTAAALQVLRLMSQGKTQEQACSEVGVTPETFRRIRDQDPEGLLVFQELITTTTREMIGELIANRVSLLRQIMADGQAPDTKPADRVVIYRLMRDELGRLAEETRLETMDNAAAADVLSGPDLSQAPSRFSIVHDGKKTVVTIDNRPEILDLRAVDSSPEYTPPGSDGDESEDLLLP